MTDLTLVGGSQSSKGPWCPSSKVRSIAMFGATEVDFRQAQMPEGTIEVTRFSLLGINNAIVTSDMPVTITGLSLLGSRSVRRSPAKQLPPASAKSLQVTGTNILGKLCVKDMP